MTKVTVDFDKSMRNVNSIAQLNEKQYQNLSKSVLGLAGKTAQAPKTLADGLYDLVSSGFSAKDSLHILSASAKAATAGLTTTEVSTKAVAAVLNAYHRPAKDAAKVSDTLFQTVNKGVITFEELASNIGDVLPFASTLGVNLQGVGAAISTMTKAGISAPETMTRIKSVMVAMIAPSDALQQSMDRLGVKGADQLIKKFGGGREGLQGALEAIIKTTDGSSEAIARLFPNVRAQGAAFALLGKNTKGANADLKSFGDVSGATNTALKEQSKSVSFQWNKLTATIKAISITFASAFIPGARTGLAALTKFANDAARIFSRKDLDIGEKFSRAWEAAKIDLGPIVRKLVSQLRSADIPSKLETVFETAAPKIADALATAAPRAAVAFVNAFKNAGTWGKLLTAAFLLNKLGGFNAAGSAAAGLMGKAFRPILVKALAKAGLAGGAAAAGAQGVASGAVTGAMAAAGRVAGTAYRVAFLSAATFGLSAAVAKFVDEATHPQNWGGKVQDAIDKANKNKGAIRDSGPKAKGSSFRAAAEINLLFPDDAAIAKLQDTNDKLQAAFDRHDQVMEKAALKAALRTALNEKVAKGVRTSKEKAKDIAAATRNLAGFNLAADRASRLAKINVEVKGIERLRSFREALAGITTDLKGKVADALDVFHDQWEKTVGADLDKVNKQALDVFDSLAGAALDAFDAGTAAAIREGPAALALADLEAQAAAIQSAAEDAANAKALADARMAGDSEQVAAAEAQIAETARQRAITQATVAAEAERVAIEAMRAAERKAIEAQQIADRQALEDQQQVVRQARYDADSSAFEVKLNKDLQAEYDQLEARKETYAQFATDVNKILRKVGVVALDVSTDVEAALTAGPGTKKKTVKKRHAGGPVAAGEMYIVGGPGAEELFVPQRSGQVVPLTGPGARTNPLIGEVNVYESQGFDENRLANLLAWKIETAAA